MHKPDPAPAAVGKVATAEDVRRILGELDDTTVVSILALQPSVGQIEAARLWLNGSGDVLAKEGRPLDGVVAAIFDMLDVDEEEIPSPPR
jgi:hypothetical protein